jgi:carbonic anhydrase
MSTTDELLSNAERYAETFDGAELPSAPAMRVAVVACMDARLDVFRLLGLRPGDANVIRNAGGVVTDDVIRSLLISQRKLGTDEIVLIHHTDCGMLKFTDDELKSVIEAETGVRPQFVLESFADVDDDVRESIRRIEGNPFLLHKQVRGMVYDDEDGALREVTTH